MCAFLRSFYFISRSRQFSRRPHSLCVNVFKRANEEKKQIRKQQTKKRNAENVQRNWLKEFRWRARMCATARVSYLCVCRRHLFDKWIADKTELNAQANVLFVVCIFFRVSCWNSVISKARLSRIHWLKLCVDSLSVSVSIYCVCEFIVQGVFNERLTHRQTLPKTWRHMYLRPYSRRIRGELKANRTHRVRRKFKFLAHGYAFDGLIIVFGVYWPVKGEVRWQP